MGVVALSTNLHWVLENPVLVLTVLLLTIALNVAIASRFEGFLSAAGYWLAGRAVRDPRTPLSFR
jgi:hypothetical protein